MLRSEWRFLRFKVAWDCSRRLSSEVFFLFIDCRGTYAKDPEGVYAR